MRRLLHASLALCALVASATFARAQALGPQRQFLAIEPYYEHLGLDVGNGLDRASFNGFGGRLWINTDPFHFVPNGSLALFLSYAPSQHGGIPSTASAKSSDVAFGGEYDQYLARRPLGGIIDPFLTVGYERFSLRNQDTGSKQSYNGLPVGGGLRIPLSNRFELRGDVKDLILFSVPNTGCPCYTAPPNPGGFNPVITSTVTTNNLLLQAGLGLTF